MRKVNKYKILRYNILKKLRSGITLFIYPTFRCNLKCDYCSMRIGKSGLPKSEEMTLNQWKQIIDTFSVKVKEIVICGGEPLIYKSIVELCDWILDNRYLLTIFTNLPNYSLCDLPKTRRLKFVTTFHCKALTETQKVKWKLMYKKYSTKFRVDAKELQSSELDFSLNHKFTNVDRMSEIHRNQLQISPDGLIFTNCYDRINYYK